MRNKRGIHFYYALITLGVVVILGGCFGSYNDALLGTLASINQRSKSSASSDPLMPHASLKKTVNQKVSEKNVDLEQSQKTHMLPEEEQMKIEQHASLIKEDIHLAQTSKSPLESEFDVLKTEKEPTPDLLTLPVAERGGTAEKTEETKIIRTDSGMDEEMGEDSPSTGELKTNVSETNESYERLSLYKAMRLALANNIDIKISSREADEYRYIKQRRGSVFFPHFSISSSFRKVDQDRAELSGPLIFEEQSKVRGEITQIIFSDRVWSEFKQSGLQEEAKRFEKENVKLDTLKTAALYYILFREMSAILRMDELNLAAVAETLAFAKSRAEAGILGEEAVYRWESEQSELKGKILKREALLEKARIALNRVMGIPSEKKWRLEDSELDEEFSVFLGQDLLTMLSGRSDAEFRKFVTIEALKHNPAIKALGKVIEAQHAAWDEIRRRRFLPEITAQGEYGYVLDESGGENTFGAERDSNVEWGVTLSATLPLFEGGELAAASKKELATLEKLLLTRKQLWQIVEEDATGSFYELKGAYPNIGLSQESADMAYKNLEIMEQKYQEGTVLIIELIETQKDYFNKGEQAVIAKYDFIRALINFQRSLSSLENFMTASEENNSQENYNVSIN
ncbi:MAG: TolC family protein [Verrucomicrobiota bacterium]